MAKVAVVTDSNSGITQKQAEQLGIYVLPMPFFINDQLYYEDIDLSQEDFYKHLTGDAEVHTSQPSPGDIMSLWDKLLKDYEQVVHIPMSSGLSTSCDTAMALSRDYDGRVCVVNNQRISLTQRHSALEAKELADAGMTAQEIEENLMREKLEASIYIMVDTLDYLKKGGRITPAAAMIGSVLNLKPVLQIQGEKLDSYAKVRGQKQAKKSMIQAIKNDFATRFKGKEMYLDIAHTANEAAAAAFLADFKKEIDMDYSQTVINPLSLSVACHIGPGSLAVAVSKKLMVNF